MKALIIYESQYGNTEQIARAVAQVLQDWGSVRLLAADQADSRDLEVADLLVVGGPTQRHGLPPALHSLLENIPPNILGNTPALAFDTRFHWARWLTGSAAGQIAKRLERAGFVLFAPPESFFVLEEEGPLADGELARAAEWARRALDRLVTVAGLVVAVGA
jgi:flavodoxin